MSIDSPKTHDPAPVFVKAIRARDISIDAGVLDSLMTLSQELAKVRGPAFYQETAITNSQLAIGSGASSALSSLQRLYSRNCGTPGRFPDPSGRADHGLEVTSRP